MRYLTVWANTLFIGGKNHKIGLNNKHPHTMATIKNNSFTLLFG